MWHLYNLILEVSRQLHLVVTNPHRSFRAIKFAHLQSGKGASSRDLSSDSELKIFSRVQTETATGSTNSHRVKTTLTLSVQKMHFSAAVSSSNTTAGNDPEGASPSQGASLSIAGQVTEENPFVKMGAYHTLDLEVNRDVRIVKAEWDSIALSRVREACEEGKGAEVGAIVCGEGEHGKFVIVHY